MSLYEELQNEIDRETTKAIKVISRLGTGQRKRVVKLVSDLVAELKNLQMGLEANE